MRKVSSGTWTAIVLAIDLQRSGVSILTTSFAGALTDPPSRRARWPDDDPSLDICRRLRGME